MKWSTALVIMIVVNIANVWAACIVNNPAYNPAFFFQGVLFVAAMFLCFGGVLSEEK